MLQKLIETPELIFAVIAAVLVKVKASKTLTFIGAILTIIIATFAGVSLHVPIRDLLSIDPQNDILVAVVTALLFESVAKMIIDTASEPGGFKRMVTAVMLRDPSILTKDDDAKKD